LNERLTNNNNNNNIAAHDLQTGQEVALKIEDAVMVPSRRSHLENEVQIYEELSGGAGIPRVYCYGEECEYRVIAFELLGPNLEDLFNYCSRQFSLKTVLMLADQLILRFQYIHSKGFVHRDIKPDNLLMGNDKQGNKVYVTDIGLAQEIDPGHERTLSPLVGTVPYASINAHLGKGGYYMTSIKEKRLADM
jgi:serine/threonine protein kinase